ncbi:MAG: hypothetical protein PHG89_00910 [Gallionella sp.]|nr:hypothetical protein [Gallionella sp.]
MKKIVLSLASVLAATAFAPEASAVPSFARQTGMACNACHFQTYPALTSFGRAFKSGGYTMMGAQGKVEGEHGLSIPDTLNASIYTQLRYIKTNGSSFAAGNTKTANGGRFDFPDEMALFVGGRVSENIGAMIEIAIPGGVSMANFKMPFIFDAGSAKIGVIPFTSAGIGPSAGFELFATGANAAGRITENGMGYSAAEYLATSNNAPGAGLAGGSTSTGVALVASSDQFHISLTPYSNSGPAVQTSKLGGTYLRAAWTPSYNNWDMGLGLQYFTGKPGNGAAVVAPPQWEAKATIIDGQAQGEVSGMPLGIYASYGRAPASSATPGVNGEGVNGLNSSTTNSRTAFGVMGDLWVMPGTLGLQLGFMRAKTGLANATTLAQENDNSITIGARYKIRQNVKFGLAYTKFSGSAYDIGGSGGANTANYAPIVAGVAGAPAGSLATGLGSSRLTAILSAGF